MITGTEQWASLARASDYAKPDPPQGTYSAQMTSAGSYFETDEVEIDSVDDLHDAITTLIVGAFLPPDVQG